MSEYIELVTNSIFGMRVVFSGLALLFMAFFFTVIAGMNYFDAIKVKIRCERIATILFLLTLAVEFLGGLIVVWASTGIIN